LILTICRFQPLPFGAPSDSWGMSYLGIPVPSRLYFPPSQQKPLNGLRISVKDNFHIDGIVSSLGSRSYEKLYGPQSLTSLCVQNLVEHGAVVVGKTAMATFAGSEVPPWNCIDYPTPWNPRGDKYQGPSGSSSGAASSVANYDWLDLALGTDSKSSACEVVFHV
jgi:Asp-tRNA(Asn)/Glu-tRNA(Gln) amidotransferase A subunit family amidase